MWLCQAVPRFTPSKGTARMDEFSGSRHSVTLPSVIVIVENACASKCVAAFAMIASTPVVSSVPTGLRSVSLPLP